MVYIASIALPVLYTRGENDECTSPNRLLCNFGSSHRRWRTVRHPPVAISTRSHFLWRTKRGAMAKVARWRKNSLKTHVPWQQEPGESHESLIGDSTDNGLQYSGPFFYKLLRPTSASFRVTWSANSISAPIGKPCAKRVIFGTTSCSFWRM